LGMYALVLTCTGKYYYVLICIGLY